MLLNHRATRVLHGVGCSCLALLLPLDCKAGPVNLSAQDTVTTTSQGSSNSETSTIAPIEESGFTTEQAAFHSTLEPAEQLLQKTLLDVIAGFDAHADVTAALRTVVLSGVALAESSELSARVDAHPEQADALLEQLQQAVLGSNVSV